MRVGHHTSLAKGHRLMAKKPNPRRAEQTKAQQVRFTLAFGGGGSPDEMRKRREHLDKLTRSLVKLPPLDDEPEKVLSYGEKRRREIEALQTLPNLTSEARQRSPRLSDTRARRLTRRRLSK